MEHNNSVITSTDELERVLQDFNNLLAQEQHALLNLPTEQLDAVVSKKVVLLQRINGIHPNLLSRLQSGVTDESDSSVPAQIAQLIESCKQVNRENGAVVAQGLKMCRNSMDILRSNNQQHSVELYNPQGETRSDMGRREIGRA